MTHPHQTITRFVQQQTVTVALHPTRITIALTHSLTHATLEAALAPDHLVHYNLPHLDLEEVYEAIAKAVSNMEDDISRVFHFQEGRMFIEVDLESTGCLVVPYWQSQPFTVQQTAALSVLVQQQLQAQAQRTHQLELKYQGLQAENLTLKKHILSTRHQMEQSFMGLQLQYRQELEHQAQRFGQHVQLVEATYQSDMARLTDSLSLMQVKLTQNENQISEVRRLVRELEDSVQAIKDRPSNQSSVIYKSMMKKIDEMLNQCETAQKNFKGKSLQELRNDPQNINNRFRDYFMQKSKQDKGKIDQTDDRQLQSLDSSLSWMTDASVFDGLTPKELILRLSTKKKQPRSAVTSKPKYRLVMTSKSIDT